MRLLHTEDLFFEEFYDTNLPPYAILSHRWGEKEVSLGDLRKHRAQEGPGLAKIKGICKLAFSHGYDWVWIDTCCIDRKSSAELSEAINSMYRWYQRAEVCYAYLSDVTLSKSQNIVSSAWFSRGWTLQELLAPDDVVFYDSEWVRIGDKSELAPRLSAVTGIQKNSLLYHSNRESACIATKMYWASRRETSRPEDIAYCLLGIFDINMPLLYGEGSKKAFIRLQKEILNSSDDETIFAWVSSRPSTALLADSPSFFTSSIGIRPAELNVSATRTPWAMTNKGLQFTLEPDRWREVIDPGQPKTIITEIDCEMEDRGVSEITASLILRKSTTTNSWYRLNGNRLDVNEDTLKKATVPRSWSTMIYVTLSWP